MKITFLFIKMVIFYSEKWNFHFLINTNKKKDKKKCMIASEFLFYFLLYFLKKQKQKQKLNKKNYVFILPQ